MIARLRMSFSMALAISTCQAFSPNSLSSTRSTPAICFLTIEDGSDLVAASQQVYRPVQVRDDDGEDLLNPEDIPLKSSSVELEPSLITSPRDSAIAFVKRLFAQPTASFHPHQAEGLDEYSGDGDDVVYFPIVGFTFVRDGPNHCRALPGVSNPSCRIRGDLCDQSYYGTWSLPSV